MTCGVHPSVTTRGRKGEPPLALCGLATRAGCLRHVGPAHVANAHADARRGAHNRGLGWAALVGRARMVLSISFHLFWLFPILYVLYSN
jgi:hypothetical protein